MKTSLTKKIASLLLVFGLGAALAQAQGLGLKSVGSVQKKDSPTTQVTVVFSEPVDSTTGSDPSKYGLGAGVTINSATLMTGLPGLNEPGNGDPPLRGRVIDNQCVVLEVTGLGAAKTTLTVNGVKSADGSQTLNTTMDFTPSGYSWVEIARIYTKASDPGWVSPGHREGKVIADSDNGFDIFNNGRAGWAGEDEFTFAYKEVTGDFDFKSRLEFADSASRWSRAGIMVRERLDNGVAEGCQSRYMTAHADPPKAFSDTVAQVVAGNNTYESNARIIDYSGADPTQANTSPGCGNGLHTDFSADAVGAGGGTPEYPVAWVRLIRAGSTITASWSNDGATWTDLVSRIFDPPLPAKMFLGPAYCAEWANISALNGAAARSRYYLTQHRWGALTTPYVKTVTGSPVGFIATVQDLQTKLVKSTLQLWLNDVSVPATSVTGPDANGVTTVTYTAPDILPNNSTNSVKIQFNDNNVPPNLITKITSFTVSYVGVLEDYATTTFLGTKGTMMVSAHQMPSGTVRSLGDTTMAATETELQDGFIDPATGQPVVSEVDTSLVTLDPGVVNFTQTPPDAGYFNSTNTLPGAQVTDGFMPGGVSGNNYALQFVGYADLKKGAYRMFVNSDDGFKFSIGPNALDVLGAQLGIFDGGRGMTPSADPAPFDFVVTKDGVYPFRLIYGQGTGDASVEWYMLDSSGKHVLINDTAAPVKTYANGRGRAYIKKFLPYPGSAGVGPRPTLTFQVVDDLTTVDVSSVKVILDGTELTNVSKTKSGTTITVTWTPPADYPFESKHTGQFIYTESNGKTRTENIDFTIKGFLPGDLPNNSFWIEVEDFDYGSGQHLAVADTAIGTDPTPYTGGAYDNTANPLPTRAVFGVDYQVDRGPVNGTNSLGENVTGGYVYRTDIPEWVNQAADLPDYFVPLYSNLGAGVPNTRPGGVTVTVNYQTGWSGPADWYDYTRNVPNGIYRVFLAASHWNNTDPPADGQINSTLDKVTAGVGTTNQILQRIGSFYGPANGSTETLTTLRGSDGTPAVIKANGKTTFRFTIAAGDSDWFVLAPASGVPAKLVDIAPANGVTAIRSAPITARIEDFNTTTVLNTVKLLVDGQDVTTQANPTKNADITTLSYTPSPIWAVTTHTYILQYSDSAGTNFAVTNSFTANALSTPGQFVIEAEDFDYDGGKANPKKGTKDMDVDVMPYKGGAYEALGAKFDIDYHNDDDHTASETGTPPHPVYRYDASGTGDLENTNNIGANIDANLGGQFGQTRGIWDMTVNYKIGWIGTGDWENYTRTFPTNNYEVYAALSYGADPTNTTFLSANLQQVTAGVGTTSQTVADLGTFVGPATGGWGANALVPMKDTGGNQAVVSLGGVQTLRMNNSGGDFDYLVLVPSTVTPRPQFTSIKLNADKTITVIWTGGGTLQTTTSLSPPIQWTDVATTSPQTLTPAGNTLFGRLKK